MSYSADQISRKQKYSFWFVLIVAIFVTGLITANIIAVKIVMVAGITFPAGVVIFPISYIFGDVLTEVYGYRLARSVIWLGFFCNLLVVVAIFIAQILPPAPFWQGQQAFEQILGFTPRLLAASFIAYLAGEFANSFVLSRLKIISRGRKLWVRTIGSTLVGEGLDSLIFISFAFAGILSRSELYTTIWTQWWMKTFYEILATPITYWIVNWLKKVDGVDTFDSGISYNPFKLGGN